MYCFDEECVHVYYTHVARLDIVIGPSYSPCKDPTSEMASTRGVTHLLRSRVLLQQEVDGGLLGCKRALVLPYGSRHPCSG